MRTVHIIVGSVMGGAFELARHIADSLRQRQISVRLNRQFQTGDLLQDADEITLICTSNTGMGDLPANISPLLHHLTNDSPPLAGKPYALINLGDSSYPNFAQAGHKLDEALQDLGAIPLIDMLVIDAIYHYNPIDAVEPWLTEFQAKL